MIIVMSNPKTLDKLKRNRNLISCSYSFRLMDRQTDVHLMFQQFVLRVLNFDTSSSIESMFIHVSVRLYEIFKLSETWPTQNIQKAIQNQPTPATLVYEALWK